MLTMLERMRLTCCVLRHSDKMTARDQSRLRDFRGRRNGRYNISIETNPVKMRLETARHPSRKWSETDIKKPKMVWDRKAPFFLLLLLLLSERKKTAVHDF